MHSHSLLRNNMLKRSGQESMNFQKQFTLLADMKTPDPEETGGTEDPDDSPGGGTPPPTGE